MQVYGSCWSSRGYRCLLHMIFVYPCDGEGTKYGSDTGAPTDRPQTGMTGCNVWRSGVTRLRGAATMTQLPSPKLSESLVIRVEPCF